MDKETMEKEANRLHVDLSGLTWPQKQGAVMAAQKAEAAVSEESNGLTEEQIRDILNDTSDDIFSPVSKIEFEDKSIKEVIKEEVVTVHVPRDPMEEMRGKSILIAPEMAPTPNQLFGYEEVLDDDIVVEEVIHSVGGNPYSGSRNEADGTYNIVGKSNKKVIAKTALPKEGAGITFRPDVDRVPVVTWQGRKGYLWTHHRLPNIKQLLIESGYYEDYRHRFKDEPFVWHAAGKLLCCDIQLAENILRDIEKRVRDERILNGRIN